MKNILLAFTLTVFLTGCAANVSTSNPVPTIDGTPLPSVMTSSENITVTSPAPYQEISTSLTITGEARVFENTLNYRLKDDAGTVLQEGYTTADSPDIGQFGPYEINIESFVEPSTPNGIIEVFSESPKDGSEINIVRIPIIF